MNNSIRRRSMKQIKKDLQTVLKSLKTLTQATEKMVRRIEKLDKSQVARKPRVKAVAKAARVKKSAVKKAPKKTAIDSVLAIINRTKKGATINDLRKKTQLSDNHIRVILYRLKKRGQIKSEIKGVYTKV
jgi:hypothetical protein